MAEIEVIQLNENENSLFASIIWDGESLIRKDIEDRIKSLGSLGLLAESLIERKAIPQVRLSYFTDPEMNVGGHGKSRKEIFEGNGTSGKDILRHPHFAAYLHYFINGPDLPKSVISGFCKIIEDDSGTSGMVLDEICAYVRQAVRSHSLDKDKAANEFFKLTHEIKRPELAENVRSAAKSVRN